MVASIGFGDGGYYCGMKSIGKNAGDHRITKAISLTSKENEKSRRSNKGSSK